VAINDSFINGYWWLLVPILLIDIVAIIDYFINGYWWLLVVILSMGIGDH
jgi:hypothetical protein